MLVSFEFHTSHRSRLSRPLLSLFLHCFPCVITLLSVKQVFSSFSPSIRFGAILPDGKSIITFKVSGDSLDPFTVDLSRKGTSLSKTYKEVITPMHDKFC